MEKSFKQLVINEIKSRPKGFMEEIAKRCGYSSGSALGKILNNPEKEFEKFQSLILLVKELWENEYIEMVIRYSKEVHVNKATSQNLLEFFAHNRQFEALNNLLDRMDHSTNKKSLEWVKMYRMQYKYELSQTKEEFNSLLNEINEIYVNSYELKTYKKMLSNYCFEQLEEYNMVKLLSSEIEEEVKQIENSFIKEMYTIRKNEIMSYNYLFVYNNPEKARECAEEIISSNAATAYKAYAYYITGHSYLFTSYEKTIKYLNMSIDGYEKLNRQHDIKNILEKIEFVNIVWNKKTNVIQINPKEIEWKLYFEGVKNKDNKKLMLSLIEFIRNDNLFLASLPKIELLKNGYDEDLIEGMLSIKIAA
jgi:hypothetical protein